MTDSERSGETRKKIEALEAEIRRLKKVKSELAESEEKYRLLVENANDAIFIVQDGRVKFPNSKGREISRRLDLDLDKKPFIEYVDPADQEIVIDRHQRRLRGEALPHTYTFRIIGGNGQEMTVALNAVLIQWQGRPATLNFLRDISAQKELEARLEQAKTLESLGTMAGGMAHDFNNLLMSIRADASAIQLGADTTERQRSMVEGILNAVSSGEAMTKQLLGFARKDACQFSPTDINTILDKAIDMFRPLYPAVTVWREFESPLWSADADPVQLERVFLNLMVNAGQAMPSGGDMILTTRNETFDRQRAMRLGLLPGQYVQVVVADNGPGMEDAILNRVFEPFFTTKAKGQGTGLGLACSFGIVQSHRGNLIAASRPGEGARFDIYLPVSAGDASLEADREGSFHRKIGETHS
jgi:PAS domain S-box-containing protein